MKLQIQDKQANGRLNKKYPTITSEGQNIFRCVNHLNEIFFFLLSIIWFWNYNNIIRLSIWKNYIDL